MTPQEFIKQWSGEFLVQANPVEVETVQIPLASKRFLVEAGLPRSFSAYFRFSRLAGRLQTIADLLKEEYGLLPEFNRYRVIGNTGYEEENADALEMFEIKYGIKHPTFPGRTVDDVYLCLDEANDGAVIRFSNKYAPNRTVDFINSSVVQFAECLLVYEECRVQIAPMWEELPASQDEGIALIRRAGVLTDALKNEIEWIDPQAMREEYSWSKLVEELEI